MLVKGLWWRGSCSGCCGTFPAVLLVLPISVTTLGESSETGKGSSWIRRAVSDAQGSYMVGGSMASFLAAIHVGMCLGKAAPSELLSE